ncbi:hypothetical protein GGI07_001824 [Coemansia sp. Benny D115]|nr:hypothetical protein GGI07_001824 [Coemansia sp. Benny D115]
MFSQALILSKRIALRPLRPLRPCRSFACSTVSPQRPTPAPVHSFEKYSPKVVESDWYEWWQTRGLFKPHAKGTRYTMLLPPPNVTGVLHIGHALTLSIQDAIARFHRMHGYSVSWVPGTDHAGISMQTVVEKKLQRDSGQSRHDLGREGFVSKVWEWKQAYGERIKVQTKRIGASVDWSQEYFTMDDGHSAVVRDTFIRLFDEGLVYRDTRIVNWSCALQSVISDIEITPAHDANDYACAQRNGLSVVSVFLPDGTVTDKNPLFKDYSRLTRWDARRKVIRALTQSGAYLGKKDAEASSINKCSRSGDIIEPMLRPQWYVRCGGLAQRADEMVQSGEIELFPERQRAVWHNWLKEIQDWCVSRQLWWGHRIPAYRVTWLGSQEHVWVAAESEQRAREKALASNPGGRIDTVIQDEDVLDTWFSSGLLPVSVLGKHPHAPDSAGRALSSMLETGQDILFFWVARMAMLCTHLAQRPPFSKVLLHPMVRDAQGRKMSKSLGNIIDPMDVINGAELKKLQETLKGGYLSKEELGKSTRELQRLYPKGFQQFGADALRFTLLLYTQQTQQINMSLDNVKSSFHLCNKLWNTFRFVDMHASKAQLAKNGGESWFEGVAAERLAVFDRALLSKLRGMLDTYHTAMHQSKLAVAAEAVRDFLQHDLCDRYIEVCKMALFGKASATAQDPDTILQILLGALETVLRALHPFMPFLTEELWQRQERVGASGSISIMEKVWEPTGLQCAGIAKADLQAERENELILGIVSGIRSLKQRHGSSAAAFSVSVLVDPSAQATTGADLCIGEQALQTALRYKECVKYLSKEPEISVCTSAADEDTMVSFVVSPQVQVKAKLVDNGGAGNQEGASAAAIAKLEKELDAVLKIVNSAGYQNNAPLTVKESDR